jgi:hypothetical protein
MRRHTFFLFVLALVTLTAGCATPGPLHIYSVEKPASVQIDDNGTDWTRAGVPSFLDPGDRILGFAYDPFTDHFFLRLAENKVRVVDRPARKIKREFTIEGAASSTASPISAKPIDGHLFLSVGTEGNVIETTRLGKPVRTFSLSSVRGPVTGLAYDSENNQLLAVEAAAPRRVSRYTLEGKHVGMLELARLIVGPIAYDAERHELYAPLGPNGASVGVFGASGTLLRTIDAPATFIAVGPRSFLRVF